MVFFTCVVSNVWRNRTYLMSRAARRSGMEHPLVCASCWESCQMGEREVIQPSPHSCIQWLDRHSLPLFILFYFFLLMLILWLMQFFCIVVSQVSCPYWISVFGIIFPRCISWCFSKLNFTLFSGCVRNVLRFLCIISDFTATQSSLFNILWRCYLYAILIIRSLRKLLMSGLNWFLYLTGISFQLDIWRFLSF